MIAPVRGGWWRGLFLFPREVRSVVDHISPTRLDRLLRLIDAGQEARFYWWREWADPDPARGTRGAVLRLEEFECQL